MQYNSIQSVRESRRVNNIITIYLFKIIYEQKVFFNEKRNHMKMEDTRDKKKSKNKDMIAGRIHIYKVLKMRHPDIGISTSAMNKVQKIINEIFERVASMASKLARDNKEKVITWHHIQSAVRLVLVRELVDPAVRKGTEAMAKTA